MSTNREGYAALVIVSLIFALFAPVSRMLGMSLDTFEQLWVRNLLAGILFFLFLKSRSVSFQTKFLNLREWWILTFRSLVSWGIGAATYVAAINNGEISHVTLIVGLPTSAFWGILLMRERPSLSEATLLAFSIMGFFLISTDSFGAPWSIGKGELYALISSLTVSLGLSTRKWHGERLLDTTVSFWTLVISVPALLLVSLFAGERQGFTASPALFVILLAGSLLAVGGSILAAYGFSKVSSVTAGNILLLESVFGWAIGVIFYNETPTLRVIFGGVLIIGGTMATSLDLRLPRTRTCVTREELHSLPRLPTESR